MKKCWRDWKTDFLSKYEKISIKLETNSNKRINKGITKKTELECLHKKRKKFFFIKLLHETQQWVSFIMTKESREIKS